MYYCLFLLYNIDYVIINMTTIGNRCTEMNCNYYSSTDQISYHRFPKQKEPNFIKTINCI